jgi:general secretion pathway protein D
VILKVTPHINESRYVTLDVRQEVSQAQTNSLGGTESPIIRNRIAETTMVVKDGQTLVIGGLIEETSSRSREGLPYLSKIPILGYLFGETIEVMSKKELVLLITPRVVANPEEGNRVSRRIRDRVLSLKKGIDFLTSAPDEEEQ